MGTGERTPTGMRVHPHILPFVPWASDHSFEDGCFHVEGICEEGPVVVRVVDRYVDHQEQAVRVAYQIFCDPDRHGWGRNLCGEWVGYWEPTRRPTAWERLLGDALMV